MIDFTTAPKPLKIVLSLLALIFLMHVLSIFLEDQHVLDIVRAVFSGLILLGMFYRNKGTYYVVYTLVTISIYGTFAIMIIQLADTKGAAFSTVAFWVATLLMFVPLVIVYRYMGKDEVKSVYVGTDKP